jgi:hypothetical protein
MPACCQLLAAGVQQGVQQGAVDRVLGQHRAHDDLIRGDHGLAVVPGHVALLVAHHPHVRVGDVRPRPGAGPVRARRLIGRPAPAPFPRRRGRLPGFLPGPLRLAARRVLSRQPVPGPGQPLPPLGPAGQRPRRGRLRGAAVLRVVGGVRGSRLSEHLLNLRQRPVRFLRGVAGQFRPIQAQQAQRHHALGGEQPQHLAEQPAQRCLVPGPEPGDGGVIRMQPAGDHPVADVPHAPLLDHPAGPLALAVPVQQQRDHHLRAGRRPPVAIGPVAGTELAQIQGGHRVQHHEDQIVLGQPLAHVHRQQQRLIPLRIKEILRHTPSSQAAGLPPWRRAVYATG